MSVIRATASYNARREDELSFHKGDTLQLVDKGHGDGGLPWMEAELDGQRGFVPSLYFVHSPGKPTSKNKSAGHQKTKTTGLIGKKTETGSKCVTVENHPTQIGRDDDTVAEVIARSSYIAKTNDELSFEKGDKLQVVDRGDDDLPWLEAKLNDRTGFVPARYLNIPRGMALPKKHRQHRATTKSAKEAANGLTAGNKFPNIRPPMPPVPHMPPLPTRPKVPPVQNKNDELYEEDIYEIPFGLSLDELKKAVERLSDTDWQSLVDFRATYMKRNSKTHIEDDTSSDGSVETTDTSAEKQVTRPIPAVDIVLEDAYRAEEEYLMKQGWYTTKYSSDPDSVNAIKDLLLCKDSKYPDGSFIVAKTADKQLYISVKHGENVNCFKILHEHKGFMVWVVAFPTLQELIQYYKGSSISRTETILLVEKYSFKHL